MGKKSKSILLLAFMCILMVTANMQVHVSAAKKHADHTAEYARFGITVKGSAYYYNDERIRIFHDMKADNSFENSFVDLKGTVDVRLIRGKRGGIKTLELIPKAEANEILEDLFGYVPSRKKETVSKSQKQSLRQKKAGTKTKKNGEYSDIKRCERGDVPDDVQTIIKKQCTGNSWYVIKTGNKKYVYYNNLPRDYAFNISGENLNVRDMGRHTGIYVLLSLGSDFNFTLSYNAKPVTFTAINAN